MPSTSVFPLEIQETILDLLAEDDVAQPALKACSLVCQAFLPICRKHIFRSIVLSDYGAVPPRATHAFERLLARPEIANYIRSLDYTIERSTTSSPTIQESLNRISRLEKLTFRCYNRMEGIDWSNNPIRPALLRLLHLPTLTHFNVARFSNFVVSDLIPCVNLKYLQIGPQMTVAAETTFHAALPERSIQLNEIVVGFRTGTVLTKLCTARRPDGQPLIDVGSLSKITMTLDKPEDGEASQELFRHCQNLTNVHISFWDPEVKPSLSDMLRPSMQTLKHIVMEIQVGDDDVDPLFGIPVDLANMRSQNIIESIRIVVQVDAVCRQGDDWGRLDEALTTPGWLSLKSVSLAIMVVEIGRRDNSLQEALRKLPETQFPRLSSSNSVSFDFKFNTQSY